jgi:hypothetical protein
MPAVDSNDATELASFASDILRYPPETSRTSARDWRAMSMTSAISSRARAGLADTRRLVSSAFKMIADRLYPSRSCRSLAKRIRSLMTASCASSARVACNCPMTTARRVSPNTARPTSIVAIAWYATSDTPKPISHGSTTMLPTMSVNSAQALQPGMSSSTEPARNPDMAPHSRPNASSGR